MRLTNWNGEPQVEVTLPRLRVPQEPLGEPDGRPALTAYKGYPKPGYFYHNGTKWVPTMENEDGKP